MEALIAAASAVVVTLLTVVGGWLNSRNDRALTAQELKLLAKLPDDSDAARDLSEVIDRRVYGWLLKAQQRKSEYPWIMLTLIFSGSLIYVGGVFRGRAKDFFTPESLNGLGNILIGGATVLLVGVIGFLIKEIIEQRKHYLWSQQRLKDRNVERGARALRRRATESTTPPAPKSETPSPASQGSSGDA